MGEIVILEKFCTLSLKMYNIREKWDNLATIVDLTFPDEAFPLFLLNYSHKFTLSKLIQSVSSFSQSLTKQEHSFNLLPDTVPFYIVFSVGFYENYFFIRIFQFLLCKRVRVSRRITSPFFAHFLILKSIFATL